VFETSSDELMHLVTCEEMASAEFSIHLVAWISVPDEADNFHKEFTIFPESRVTCLEEREGSAAVPQVV
jgi:hypothetical protein